MLSDLNFRTFFFTKERSLSPANFDTNLTDLPGTEATEAAVCEGPITEVEM